MQSKASGDGVTPSHSNSGGVRSVTWLPAAVSAATRAAVPGVSASARTSPRLEGTFVSPPCWLTCPGALWPPQATAAVHSIVHHVIPLAFLLSPPRCPPPL